MNIPIMEILTGIIFFIVGAAATYYKTSPKLKDKTDEALTWLERLRSAAVEYIDRAEQEFKGVKRGGEKFKWVVDNLHSILPEAIKPFISKSTIEDIVQNTFDIVEGYAKQQLDKLVDKATETDNGKDA